MTSPPLPLTRVAQSNTSVCPGCGAGLRCGMVAGDAECWCVQLPHVMPVPAARTSLPDSAAASCLCPACLKKVIDERQNPVSPAGD